MKKNILLSVSALAVVAMLSGCAVPNAFGPLYSDATLSGTATGNAKGSKTGQSKAVNIIGICQGDAGIQAAAEQGGIKRITTVDIKGKSILGVWAETTTVVTGE